MFKKSLSLCSLTFSCLLMLCPLASQSRAADMYLNPTAGYPIMGDSTASGNVMTIKSTGEVGIGIASPGAVLDLQTAAGTFRQKQLTTVVTNTLTANATQARRYEIARVAIDYNDWNWVGLIEIELLEKYWAQGLKKKYYVYYGYVSNSGVYLAEVGGAGANFFQVSIGSEVVISGDNRYIPIYVDVDTYSQVIAVIKTNRGLTASNPPGNGDIWVNPSPSGTDIADFSADSVVYMNNVSGFTSVFNQGNVGIGTTGPGALLNVKGNLSSALTGTVAVTNLSATVTGTTTLFTTQLAVGDSIKIGTEVFTMSAIASDTSLTLDSAYQGATASGLTAYRDPTLLAIDNGDAVNKVTVTRSGNVGIGTTGPKSALHVVGLSEHADNANV